MLFQLRPSVASAGAWSSLIPFLDEQVALMGGEKKTDKAPPVGVFRDIAKRANKGKGKGKGKPKK